MSEIYTIGHSNHSIEHFLSLLKDNHITVVVDVRSMPYSKYATQFNKEQISSYLIKNNIDYIFLGNELGGKPNDSRFYGDDGSVLYDEIVKTEQFQRGIKRILSGVHKGYSIVLMCGEERPDECHRRKLVAKEINKHRIRIFHILSTGRVEEESELISRKGPTAIKIGLLDAQE